jgi:hypothetical protein
MMGAHQGSNWDPIRPHSSIKLRRIAGAQLGIINQHCSRLQGITHPPYFNRAASGGSAAPHGNYPSHEGIQLKPKTLCSRGLGFRSFEAVGLFQLVGFYSKAGQLVATRALSTFADGARVKAEVQIKTINFDGKMKMQYLRSSSR